MSPIANSNVTHATQENGRITANEQEGLSKLPLLDRIYKINKSNLILLFIISRNVNVQLFFGGDGG